MAEESSNISLPTSTETQKMCLGGKSGGSDALKKKLHYKDLVNATTTLIFFLTVFDSIFVLCIHILKSRIWFRYRLTKLTKSYLHV